MPLLVRSWLVAALTVAPLACGSPAPPTQPPPPSPTVPVRIVLSGADLDTLGEILRLEDRRELDVARFTGWLRSPSAEVRRRAALGAGRIGDRRASSLLLPVLGDSSARVRADAAFALGELNDSSATIVAALANVAAGNDSAAVEAIAALGRLGGAPEVVTRRLTDSGAAREVRNEALLALWRYRRLPTTLPVLLPHASSTDPETRWRAVYAMTRGNPDPAAVPHLIRWLTDPDSVVRALAARGLRAATVDSAGQRPAAAAGLRRALADPHSHVRINAVRALGGYRELTNVLPIAALVNDADGNVAIAALEALAENGNAAAELERTARDGSRSLAIRRAALNGLGNAAPATALAIAREWLASAEWLPRLFAVRELSALRSPDAGGLVRSAVNDADARVAAAALQSVAAIDTVNPPYALFIEKLAHADAAVRAAALRGVQRRAGPAELELLLSAYERAARDTQRVAALAAADALGVLARQGVPVERAFFLRFKRPRDPLLHQRIINRIGPGEWGEVRPIDTGKPPAYYRAVAHHYFHPDSAAVRPRVRIQTAAGQFGLELLPQQAPLTVLNFISLAERGYFNGGRWHRVVPNFVLQDGDPRGDGSGGPGHVIRDEINRLRYTRAAVGMALSGPDTGGSQFFITHAPQPHLDGGYTIFGYVVEGMDVADRVVQDDPIITIEVVK